MRWIVALSLLAVTFSSPAHAQCNCGGGVPALGLVEPDYDSFYNTDGNVYSDDEQVYVVQPRVVPRIALPSYSPRYYTQPYDYQSRYWGYGRCGYSAGYRVC
jgi:hypothetical protein